MRGLLPALAAALAGCAADPACPEGGEAALWIGVAPDDQAPFTEVADGADAVLNAGSQGGFHVWVQARAEGLCPDEVRLDYEVRTADTDELVGRGRSAAVMAAGEAGSYQTERALAAIVCPAPPSVDLVDREVRLILVGSDGLRSAGDERTLTLRCPDQPANLRNTCLRICDRAP